MFVNAKKYRPQIIPYADSQGLKHRGCCTQIVGRRRRRWVSCSTASQPAPLIEIASTSPPSADLVKMTCITRHLGKACSSPSAVRSVSNLERFALSPTLHLSNSYQQYKRRIWFHNLLDLLLFVASMTPRETLRTESSDSQKTA